MEEEDAGAKGGAGTWEGAGAQEGTEPRVILEPGMVLEPRRMLELGMMLEPGTVLEPGRVLEPRKVLEPRMMLIPAHSWCATSWQAAVGDPTACWFGSRQNGQCFSSIISFPGFGVWLFGTSGAHTPFLLLSISPGAEPTPAETRILLPTASPCALRGN